MTAAVLSIGTELTRGELTNTNARWLGEQLTALGFEVLEHATVDDDRGRIAASLGRLAASARVVLCTGGLGPTTDDLTTAAAADALGVALVRDPAIVEDIKRKFAAFGREMPASNEKQADFPVGARILPNPVGTAPGFAIDLSGARVFFMPGVPHEMQRMVHDHVVPSIADLARRNTCQIHLRTFGMGESAVGEKLAGIEAATPGITLGYRASFPEIEVKVLARAETDRAAEELARRVADEVRTRLGDAVYGDRDDTFPAFVGRLLRDRGLTIAVAESCTGGMIGSMVTSAPGSSEYLLLDAVTYSNASKVALLGVAEETLRAHGAVSGEAAVEMAEGALRLAAADLGVAVTGVAGPGGGTDDKPVGTVWFALARKGQPTFVRTRKLTGDRERIRTLASYIALHLVARAAQGRVLE